jgi:hypothetical protein
MSMKRKRMHTAVTVDRDSYAEIGRLAELFSQKIGTKISRTDVVRMGITALLVVYPSARKEEKK